MKRKQMKYEIESEDDINQLFRGGWNERVIIKKKKKKKKKKRRFRKTSLENNE